MAPRLRRSMLAVIFLMGLFLGWIFSDGPPEAQSSADEIQSAEHWERRIFEQSSSSAQLFLGQQPKRPRSAAAELGIRKSLLVLLLVRSQHALALWTALSGQLPFINNKDFVFSRSAEWRIQIIPFVSPGTDFPLSAGPQFVKPGPIYLLSAVANQSLHNSADWFFLLPDSSFVNLFQLDRLIDSLLWNAPLALGQTHRKQDCLLEAGVLLSAPAMLALVQGRNLCHGLAGSDHSSQPVHWTPSAHLPALSSAAHDNALEACIRLATNLSCIPSSAGVRHNWWRVSDHSVESIHGHIPRFARSLDFNQSLTISPILSDRDVTALLGHSLRLELDRTEADIQILERRLEWNGETGEWPDGLPPRGRPPNRFQVPIWELLSSEGRLFSNDPEQNVEEKPGEEKGRDWAEVLGWAREASGCTAGKLAQAYRRLSPGRGMEYLMDLHDCLNGNHKRDDSRVKNKTDEFLEALLPIQPSANALSCPGADKESTIRVALVRPMRSSNLLDKLSHVRHSDNGHLILLVSVESAAQAQSLRPLLRSLLQICASLGDSRQIRRLVVAARGVQATLIRLMALELTELKTRCHSLDPTLVLLRPDPTDQSQLQLAALEETVNRFGQQNLFLLVSPLTIFTGDFLERARLNTIRNTQVFLPIPFAEFSPLVSGAVGLGETTDFVVHKDRGRFSLQEWTASAALYGSDFVWARSRQHQQQSGQPLSLVRLFLGQSRVHLFRAIEPSLRLRHFPRVCRLTGLSLRHLRQCERERALSLGTRAQLALLLTNGGPDLPTG